MSNDTLPAGLQEAIDRWMGRWYAVAHVLMLFLHLALFGISGVMSVALLVGLAGTSTFWAFVWGSMGVAFEGTKIVLWEIGRGLQRAIALLFVVISLTFSGGAALLMVRQAEGASAISNVTTDNLQKDLAALDRMIEVQQNIIITYDQSYKDYAKVVEAAQVELLRALEDRKVIVGRIASVPTASAAASSTSDSLVMFDLMADKLNLPHEEFLLLYQFVIAGLLEVGALATTYRRKAGLFQRLGALFHRPQRSLDLPPCECGSKALSLTRNAKGQWATYCFSCKKTRILPEGINSVLIEGRGPHHR